MTRRKQNNRAAAWLLILAGVLLFWAAPNAYASEKSSDGALVLQGIVRRVSADSNTLHVKVSKGERIQIQLSTRTKLIGVSSRAELKRGQRIKVWYSFSEKTYRVVKLEVLPELGC